MRESRYLERPANRYDEVPYESASFPQTHPDRLATMGTLFGLMPAPVDRCRVLELGCAMGANLVPMAFNLPGSEFIGIDSSGRQVAAARAAAEALGLTNVRIEHASILDVDASWGRFDYIICHGVYSWVPDPVQDRILGIAAQNLEAQGIAYISYNTYPGWHMREMIRHMMRYHSGQFGDVLERIEQARALLEFLAGAVDTSSYYGSMLQGELQLVSRAPDSYLFHEHLEEVNTPLYFHEFVRRASRHGLRYLAEAEFSSMLTSGFPAATAETLERISPDMFHAEQYMDFLRNRCFRQTLLCHARLQPKRKLEPSDLNDLLLASPVAPEEKSLDDQSIFRTPDGRRVATAFPLTQAVLALLSESWPVALDPETLRSRAIERFASVPPPGELDQQWTVVLEDMLYCHSTGAVELRTWQAPCTSRISTRPRMSPLATSQASVGPLVTSQRHQAVALDPVGRCLALLLDGTRDRTALVSELLDAVRRGDLTLKEDGQVLTDEERARTALEAALNEALSSFSRSAMLVN